MCITCGPHKDSTVCLECYIRWYDMFRTSMEFIEWVEKVSGQFISNVQIVEIMRGISRDFKDRLERELGEI